MPRLSEPTKKKVGIASRVEYRRRVAAPYWADPPPEEEEEEEDDDEHHDDDDDDNVHVTRHKPSKQKYDDDDDDDDDGDYDEAESEEEDAVVHDNNSHSRRRDGRNSSSQNSQLQQQQQPQPVGRRHRRLQHRSSPPPSLPMTRTTSRRRNKNVVSTQRHRTTNPPISTSRRRMMVVNDHDDDLTSFHFTFLKDVMDHGNNNNNNNKKNLRRPKKSVIPLALRPYTASSQRRRSYDGEDDEEDHEGDDEEEEEEAQVEEYHPVATASRKNRPTQLPPATVPRKANQKASPRLRKQVAVQQACSANDMNNPEDEPEEVDEQERKQQQEKEEEDHPQEQQDDQEEDDIMDDDDDDDDDGTQKRHRHASPSKSTPAMKLQLSSSSPLPVTKIAPRKRDDEPISEYQGGMDHASPTHRKRQAHSPPLHILVPNAAAAANVATTPTRPSPRMTQVVVVTASPAAGHAAAFSPQSLLFHEQKMIQSATTSSAKLIPTLRTTKIQDVASQQSPMSPSLLLPPTSSVKLLHRNTVQEQYQQQGPRQMMLPPVQHVKNQEAALSLLSPPDVTNNTLRTSTSELAKEGSPLPLVAPPLDEAVVEPIATLNRWDKDGNSRDKLKIMSDSNVKTTASTGPVATVASATTNKNNMNSANDGCCTCCNCVRRRSGHKSDVHSNAQDNTGHDEGKGDENIIYLPKHYQELMDTWKDVDARLSKMAVKLEEVIRVVFPPLESVVPSRAASYYYQPPPPPRRRVFIGDGDDDEEEEEYYDNEMWDEYDHNMAYRRQRPTPRRPQSWPGHYYQQCRPALRERVEISSLPPVGSSLALLGNMDRPYQRRRRSAQDATYTASHDGRTPLIPPQNRAAYHETDDEPVLLPGVEPKIGRDLPTRMERFFPRSSPHEKMPPASLPHSRRSEMRGFVPAPFHHYDDAYDQEEQFMFDTQPHQQRPRSSPVRTADEEYGPWDIKVATGGKNRVDHLHPQHVRAVEKYGEQEFPSTIHAQEGQGRRKRARLTKESLEHRPPHLDETIVIDESNEAVRMQRAAAGGQLPPPPRREMTEMDQGYLTFPNIRGTDGSLAWNDVLQSLDEVGEHQEERVAVDHDFEAIGTATLHQQQIDPSRERTIHRGSISNEDNDNESALGEEQLIPFELPLPDERTDDPTAINGEVPGPSQSQQSRIQATQEQKQKSLTQTTMQNKPEDDGERIRLLDDFLSEKEDEGPEETALLDNEGDEFETEKPALESVQPSAANKAPSNHQDRGAPKPKQADRQVRQNAEPQLDTETRQKREHPSRKEQDVQRQVPSDRVPQRAETKPSRAAQASGKGLRRGKELVHTEVTNSAPPPSSAPPRTVATNNGNRKLRDVVPSFDSLAAAGATPVLTTKPRKRGRMEIGMH